MNATRKEEDNVRIWRKQEKSKQNGIYFSDRHNCLFNIRRCDKTGVLAILDIGHPVCDWLGVFCTKEAKEGRSGQLSDIVQREGT
ncbi:MAG: hypothetical protein PHG19_03230 [Anaerotignum sp.]|nr:hypothetical protein [Anaerotignum sp.]